jgi:pimeloyl-ACP methyl ester carboxylesterase
VKKQLTMALAGIAALAAPLLSPAEEITRTIDGLTVTANLETTGEGWTDGPVLLMTHGTLAHNRMEIIRTLQQVFKDRGYSSLAINLSLGLSGRKGMYDCATPHTHRHTDALDEIGLWLEWLKARGVESTVLLGHSRGGNQTAWFAAERDEPAIKGVILIAPAVWSEEAEAADYKKRYGKALAPILADARKRVAAGRGSELMDVDFIYCKDTRATAEAFVSYYAPDERMNTPFLVSKLKKPVLVFAGTADTVVPGLIDAMAPVTESQNVRFEVLDGADHFFRDLWAEDIGDMSTEFVQSL